MARPRKQEMDDDAPGVEFNASDFIRDIEEILRQKENAAEYSGMVGQATKQCAERSGIHRKAIGVCVAAKKMEPAKRTAFISDLMRGLGVLGFLDEPTLFDTPREQVKQETEARTSPMDKPKKAKASAPPPPEETDQAKDNVVRLEKGIKQLEPTDAPAGFTVN